MLNWLRQAIARCLFPDLLEQLREARETIESQASRIEQLGTDHWREWKRAEDAERKLSTIEFAHNRNIDTLINTRFEFIWRRVEEFIEERFKFSVRSFDYVIRSLVHNPKALRESTTRTFKDVAAQLGSIPLHSEKATVGHLREDYMDKDIIRIRIPPEVFSVAIDSLTLEDLGHRNEYEAT